MGFMFIFLVFPKELLHAATWLKAEGHGAKKEVCFAHRIFNVTTTIYT
jgi:hypothetical protein